METLKEVKDHVKKIKDSWSVTGCSVLLDAWIDQKGRDLVTFVADCPSGPVYLKSFDVSDIKSDCDSLLSLVDEIVDEVGTHNVVQIIAGSTTGWVGELGKSFASNKKETFWSVSVSHCFELMLLQIGKLDSVRDILDKVYKITEFINNHKIDMSFSSSSSSSSEFEFVKPYLTLESIYKKKNNLVVGMFASDDWKNKEEYTTISKSVNDFSFWESVETITKCVAPLIQALLLFASSCNQHAVGDIYDIMDDIKEDIAGEFKALLYDIMDVIDDVLNKHLYSPLHYAGYFLNPTCFYSTNFNLDQEVATGLTSSLVHVVKECDVQVKVATQIDMYRLGEDCFSEASQADQISGITPAEWWAQKASHFPELQSFAVKILSQTCEGASRFKLKRGLAEKLLLAEGTRCSEKQNLEDLAFVHYNLHLYKAKLVTE